MTRRVAAGVIERSGALLVCQRPPAIVSSSPPSIAEMSGSISLTSASRTERANRARSARAATSGHLPAAPPEW